MSADAKHTDLDMPVAPIRVLVVDDQSFMRIALRQMLEAEGDIRVVGEARNGIEAVAMARELKPDAITLDVEMPEMDGLHACEEIMRDPSPRPAIIMVSAHTQVGAEAAVQALRLGAVDFVSKSSAFAKTDLAHIDTELRPKLRAWAKRRTVASPSGGSGKAAKPSRHWRSDLIVIGASTGGPQALTKLLTTMGKIHTPIVIAQHMPEFFTASLAQMLAQDTKTDVREGEHRGVLGPSSVTLVPGARDGIIGLHHSGGYELRLVKIDAHVHPSADALFESAALLSRTPVGVILTGMGEDGAKGAAALRRKDVPVLVQSPESCIVAGMPQAACAAAPGCEALSIEEIAYRLSVWGAEDLNAAGAASP
ncbi:MAG: chemotaxis-specific protein-glutamate methyltransferase CheB [Methylovirgula sp.]|jgi:two-component system chemotaxis response regulator CheB